MLSEGLIVSTSSSNSETCLQLDEYYDREMEKIGVYQNLNKRYVFGYGDRWDGIIVVGSPLGTFDYESQQCMERVDEIKSKIDELLFSPSSYADNFSIMIKVID